MSRGVQNFGIAREFPAQQDEGVNNGVLLIDAHTALRRGHLHVIPHFSSGDMRDCLPQDWQRLFAKTLLGELEAPLR